MMVKYLLASALGGLLFAAPAAQADDAFPSRPSRLIVPYTPGGNTDLLGRVIARGCPRPGGSRWWSRTSRARPAR